MTIPPPDVAERIRQKKSQYTRFLDTKQWHQLDSIFVPDATFAFCDSNGKLISRPDGATPWSWTSLESFRAFFEKAFADRQVIHLISAGELEMVGPDEVKAVFTLLYHAGPKGDDKEAPHEMSGGHYHETWVRKGDDWFCTDLLMRGLYRRVT